MAQKITKTHFKRAVSAFLAAATAITATPPITISAEEAEKYPYTLFAGSYSEGAITTTAGNFCVNGNVATNGTIVATGNMNINGTKTENAGEEMIYIFNKIESKYFSGNNVDEYAEDYTLEEMNINVTEPLEVGGEIEMTGNINLTTAIKAYDTVSLNGEVKNTSESVICSETGDIVIDCTNVNLNGLVYAPDGSVEITAQNLNLNNVIIIADTILLDCPNVNANYSSSVAEFVGTESEVELHIYANGNYNKETDELTILWETTVPNGTFDIETSFDNKEYSTLVSVVDSNSYTYEITEDFKKMYVRVTETTSYGETVTSGPFEVKWIEDSYYVLPLDTDDDGLFDYEEPIHSTDINNPDTDGDGLTDAEEVNIIGSDPTIYDSIESGISDASADNDGDGLTNREEIDFQTNPISKDSDNDRMNDYDELYVWNTDPLAKDTDNDTIADGDEVKIGLIPTNPETFGYPDAEYKSVQVISADSSVLSAINTEDSPYSLSLEVTAAGCTESYLFGRESSYSGVMENEFMVGIAPELVYLGEHDVDNIKICFKMSDTYTEILNSNEHIYDGFDGIKSLSIFKYCEEINSLLPIATYYDLDNNTVYSDVDEFGTYCLMDIEQWINYLSSYATSNATPMMLSVETEELDAIETSTNECPGELLSDESIAVVEEVTDTISSASVTTFATRAIDKSDSHTPLDVVFILQKEGTSEKGFDEQKQAVIDTSSLIFNYFDDAKIYVIEFDYYSAHLLESNGYVDTVSLTKGLAGIEFVYNNRYCDRSKAFSVLLYNTPVREDAGKFVFNIVNGSSYTSGLASHLAVCKSEKFNYSEIYPKGWGYLYESDRIYVEDLIYSTGGMVDWVDEYIADSMFMHIRSYIAPAQVQFVGLLSTGWKEIVLKGVLSETSKNDTDADTLPDWDEIDTSLLTWDKTGKITYPTLYELIHVYSDMNTEGYTDAWVDSHCLGDSSGNELSIMDINYLYANVSILPIISDPTSDDGDGDGILDIHEFEWNGIAERYKDVSPLKSDTIETLYPELNLQYENGNNRKSNAVYLEITDNNISVHVAFDIKSNYDQTLPLLSEGKTMKELFLEGIKEYWNGSKEATLYDFYPGMIVNTNIIIDTEHISELQKFTGNNGRDWINIYLNKECGIASHIACYDSIVAGGTWRTSMPKRAKIYPCSHGLFAPEDFADIERFAKQIQYKGDSANCEFYLAHLSYLSNLASSSSDVRKETIRLMEEEYKYLCAHEFGHILGLWDAYGNDTTNNNYQITEIKSDATLPKEFLYYDIMIDNYNYVKTNKDENVSVNDIEMILQAFIDDDWQYFYEGNCSFVGRKTNQKLSKAIKHPEPPYEKEITSGLYEYYYWDRTSVSMVKKK